MRVKKSASFDKLEKRINVKYDLSQNYVVKMRRVTSANAKVNKQHRIEQMIRKQKKYNVKT